MAKYIIRGGNKLSGSVNISGNKNSILPCLCACLLSKQEVVLRNVPEISDVDVILSLLKHLGVRVEKNGREIKIQAKDIKSHVLPKDLTSKLRASILLVGPMLSRLGKVEFSHPGGDIIGRRSINTHLKGFEKLGFDFQVNDRNYKGFVGDLCQDDCQIFLEEASVTATENMIMAASSLGKNITLKNLATEPHVIDLCQMLLQMGVNIEGIGSSTLKIRGERLTGADFTISPDFIEIGTYAIAAAITGGKIQLKNCSLKDLEPISIPLEKMGVMFEEKDQSVEVWVDKLIAIPRLTVNIWPGFPTDLMSVFIVLATQSQGLSLMHDWMYESRMFFADKLISMGANITIADPHRVLVYGPTQLFGRILETPDIRAGMALVLAALVAGGESQINRAELIERGYEKVVQNLSALGANIKREG